MLFDVGNTLLGIDHARLAATIRDAGLSADAEAVAEAEMRARPLLDPHLGKAPKRETPEIFHRYVDLMLDGLMLDGQTLDGQMREGQMREGQTLDGQMLEGQRVPTDPAVRQPIHAALQAIWQSLWIVKAGDVEPTLRELLRRGYRLGCVSNSNGTVEDSLIATGLDRFLECVVDSGLEGVEKPNPRIFEIAAELMDLPPAELVYVGDFHAIDVVGARAARITPFLMDPIGAWEGHSDAIRIQRLGDLLHFLPARVDPKDGS